MNPAEIRHRTHNPEAVVQDAVIGFLRDRDWTVMPTHGNAAQKGFPDLYVVHRDYGQRWIEMKYMESYSFTVAQLEFFPKINDAGIGIWILTAATREEYAKLFDPKYNPLGNWMEYLRAYLLLGSRVYKDRIDAKRVTCSCGKQFMLRPSEKVICYCTRTVRGKG